MPWVPILLCQEDIILPKGGDTASTSRERLKMLTDASDMLIGASELIISALRMSGLERRGEEVTGAILHYTSLNGDLCSIPNIIRDLENDSDDPCWTRPLVSVKHSDRKDI